MHTDRVCIQRRHIHQLLPILDTHRPPTSKEQRCPNGVHSPEHPCNPVIVRAEGGRFVVRAVTARSARLCAAWMAAGFVHGVLNTDNMNVTGESFDSGPYRFLPTFETEFIAAYFDPTGLYVFGRQPAVVHWNLARLADALAPLSPTSTLATARGGYEPLFRDTFRDAVLKRLGLEPRGPDEDAMLVDAVVEFLDQSRTGVDRFFFDWYGGAASHDRARASTAAPHYEAVHFAALRPRLEQYAPPPSRAARPALLPAHGAVLADDRRDRDALGCDRRPRRLDAARREARCDQRAAPCE